MLTPSQVAIVKATAPLVGEKAGEITAHFYPLMFARYPQVIQLFNQTHQRKGSQPQALAKALVAYATHIDQLAALGDAVAMIANKHCSLNIQPEHYPIVGECLLESIAAVLGESVTAEVADAWSAAYKQLADILMSAEEHLYQNNSLRQGGWRGERAFRIARIDTESAVIKSFYLVPAAGEQVIDFSAGQYIGLIITVNGESVRRNYSLSEAPGKVGLRISVKREEGGLVSDYLHQQAKVGDTLMLTPPAGTFTLGHSAASQERPLLFVTGGVGITPAISMLNDCVRNGRSITFIHAAVNSDHHAFDAHLKALAKTHRNLNYYVIYEKPLAEDTPDAMGFIDREILSRFVPASGDVDLYFLGPKPFMRCVKALAAELAIPHDQCFFEFFGPVEELA